MSIQRKAVELVHTDGTIKVTFEETPKSVTPYHIQTRTGGLHLTRTEFVILCELIEDWFIKGNKK